MSKANCTYKFQTINGPVTIQGMANMKAWLAVNGVEAIIRDNAPMPENQAPGPQGDAQQGATQGNAVIEAGVKFVSEIEALAEKHGRVYIRWSPSAVGDLSGQQQSRDFQSGATHTGLSAVEVTGDMHPVDIAKRLSEYGFLRMQDKRSVPHVYLADRTGTDSDGYASIKPKKLLLDSTTEVLKAIDSNLAEVMDAMDDIQRETKKLEKNPGHYAITERLNAAKERLAKLLPNDLSSPVSVGEMSGRTQDQTQTEAFRRWFGDSKVVDADGKPLVVSRSALVAAREAASFEGGMNGGSSDSKPVADLLISQPFSLQGLSGLEIPAQRKVLDGVLSFGDDLKILRSIVEFIPVNVVNILARKNLSADALFRDKAVLKQLLSADSDGSVSTAIDVADALIVAVARMATEGASVGSSVSAANGEQNSASSTGVGDGFHRASVGQIKAIGNNGQFAPNNGDIRFRTVREAVAGTVNDFRDVALPAGYRMNDILRSAPNKLDWWSKTVGTQYNLAQRSRAYKRVFDGAQEFLSDVSFYANEAANLAPTILPKLETLSDITKKPISAEDSKAISRPIFEGTLVWGRDPSTGQAVKMEVLEARAAQLDTQAKGQELIRRNLLDPKVLRMWQGMELDRYTALVENKYANEVLKPGTTFSDKELRELFSLNDGQIKLYREFRKAVNKSLSDLAVTDMVRFGGKDVAAVRDLALAAPSVRSAAKLLRDHLLEMADADPARRDVLVDTGNAMLDKAERAVELMDQGYAPLMRFGQYTVDVLDESGERVYFGMFETAREANKMARQMQANYPGGQVVQGTLSQEEYKLFAGVSPETVELFGNLLGLESSGDSASDAAFQEFLKKVKANRSAMKRLIHRKGIAGFNEDPGRVLAGFLYSNARQASSNVHMGALTEAVNDIPKTHGELKDHAVKLRDYVMNPQEEAQALRSVLFAQYLGGSVASALLNALQPVQVTFPWLSQFGGAAKAAKQMSAAIKDVMTKAKLDDRLAKALHRAEEEGIVSPQEIHQLQAQAAGRAALVGGDGTRAGDLLAAGNNALSRVSLAWGKLFGVAEQFNRRTTFIAAYRTAVDQGMTDPAEFAKRAVQETQFVYNKGNKPRWARGAIGATLFTFKQYSVSYVELMHRMYTQGGKDGKKAALLGLAVLFLMSGADGLPFAEDVQDLIDAALQRMGYNISVRAAKEKFFKDVLWEGGEQFMERGLSGLPGSPVDVSGRMGLGNLIPGTGALYRKDNYSRDALEVLGPAGDLLGRAAQAGEKVFKGEVLGARGALMTISPLASQNLGKAYEMYSTGMYLDRGGKKVLDTDGMDAFWKSIGIQPAGVSRIQKAGFEVQKGVAFNRLSESEIADKWARGVFLGDAELVSQARADLAEWNEKNPDMPIRIKPNQIAQRVKQMRMSKDERIAKSAPSEIRARVREELEGDR